MQLLLKKLFVITLTMLVVLTICTIPTINNPNVLRTSFELEDITSFKTNSIYLLNENNLLVKVDIVNENNNLSEQVKSIINNLIINNQDIPKGLKGYLEQNTKVLNININNGLLTLELNKFNENNISVTGLSYSLLELKGINKLKIMVNGKKLKNYNIIDKSIGINNEYLFHDRNGINKVVVYYLDNIYDTYYFVPVTKYLNDKREKIEIIVDELKNNQELISMVDSNLKLLNYQEEGNVLFLNFNSELINSDETVINAIAYSSFANYDVNMVMFEVNNKKFDYRKRD